MPTSVSFNLITVSSSYDPTAPTGPNQWAYILSSGAVTRSQYEDAAYVKDDGGPITSPSGFNLGDLTASVTFLLQDLNSFIGPGAICLANPSGGGGNLAVFDFSTGYTYVYAAPSGWLASAAAWDGAHLYWAEASTTPLTGPAIEVRVRRSDAMFVSVQTVATYQYYPYPASVTTVVRPISPRLTASYFFFTVQWDSLFQDLALDLISLDFNNHSSGITPDRSYLQQDAIGYTKADGGSIYAARGTYNLSTFPLTQDVWIQADDPTEVPLPIWPDFIANPAWGNGVVVRFANLGLTDGVFQEHFSGGLVIRGEVAGETEPSPVSTFTPVNHPVLAAPPTVFAYAHPYPTPNQIDPILLSSTESSTLTIHGASIPDEEWAFIDDGAGNLYGCIYSGADYVSTRNVLVEPTGYTAVNVCINHDSAGKVGDGSLFFQAAVGSWFGNFVWDVGAGTTYPIVSGSLTTLPIVNPLYWNGSVYWWENPQGVSGTTTGISIDNDLWQSGADGTGATKVGTFTVGFPTGYTQTTINESWMVGDGLHVSFGSPSGFGLSRVIPTTVVITAGSVTGTDNGTGSIAGTGIVSGSIDYTTGFLTVRFTTAPAVSVPITVQAQSAWTTGDGWTVSSAQNQSAGAAVSSGGEATLYVIVNNIITGASLYGAIYLPLTGGTTSVAANLLVSVNGNEWGTGVPSFAGSARLNNQNFGVAPLWERPDGGGPTAAYAALWPNTGAWAIGLAAQTQTSISKDLSTASSYDGSSTLLVNAASGAFGSSPTYVYAINPVPSGVLTGMVPTLMFLAS